MARSYFKPFLLALGVAFVLVSLSECGFLELYRRSQAGQSLETMPSIEGSPRSPSAGLSPSPTSSIVAHDFISFATQRCGTHLLDEALDTHPAIAMHGELFATHLHKGNLDDRDRELIVRGFYSKQITQNLKYISTIPSRTAERNSSAIRGFDWKLNQGVFEAWDGWLFTFLKVHKMKLLWYQRRHLLRQYISHVDLKLTHVSVSTTRNVKRPRVHINVKEMLSWLSKMKKQSQAMDKLMAKARSEDLEVMSLYYENISSENPKRIDEVTSFLLQGTPSAPTHITEANITSRKMHKGALSELVENWKAVSGALQGTKWEYLLELDD